MLSLRPLKIRKARVEDVSTLLQMISDGVPEGSLRAELPDPLPSGYAEAFQRISADENQALMVAELEGTIVGTFHLTFLTCLAGAGRQDLQIEAVHVARESRGRGIGSEMIIWALDQARQRQCRRVQLTTNKLRKDAHRFYLRLGFTASHEGMKAYL